ncbi:MAG: hypothetical protein ACLFRF_06415 [Desulfobacterales bacterium]
MNMAPDENQPTDTIKYFCPLTGLEIYTRPEWQSQKFGTDYTVDFWLIGDSILYTRPSGTVNLKTIKASLQLDDAVAAHIAGGTGPYIQIEDYSSLKNVSIDARKYFIDYFNSNDRVVGLILCNLSQLMNLAVKIGQRFIFGGKTIFSGGKYRQAIEKALDICEARNLPKGTFVFNQPVSLAHGSDTLEPK